MNKTAGLFCVSARSGTDTLLLFVCPLPPPQVQKFPMTKNAYILIPFLAHILTSHHAIDKIRRPLRAKPKTTCPLISFESLYSKNKSCVCCLLFVIQQLFIKCIIHTESNRDVIFKWGRSCSGKSGADSVHSQHMPEKHGKSQPKDNNHWISTERMVVQSEIEGMRVETSREWYSSGMI